MQLIETFLELLSWLFHVPKHWHWSLRWLARLVLLLLLALIAALILTPSSK